MADRRPLINESSDLSDTGTIPPALPSLGFSSQNHGLGFGATHADVSPPTSPPQSFKPVYSRPHSDATVVERSTPSTLHEVDEEEDIADSFRRGTGNGLGIASQTTLPGRPSVQTIPRIVSIGAARSPINSPDGLNTPQTGDPLYGGFPQDSAGSTPDLRRERFSPRDSGRGYNEFGTRGALRSQASLENVDDYQQYLHSSDRDALRGGAPSFKSARTTRSAYESEFHPVDLRSYKSSC
jgi:hypothetical protein